VVWVFAAELRMKQQWKNGGLKSVLKSISNWRWFLRQLHLGAWPGLPSPL